jgi:hypothetical protein
VLVAGALDVVVVDVGTGAGPGLVPDGTAAPATGPTPPPAAGNDAARWCAG